MPMPTFDGLIFRSDGWNDELAASGLAAMHVTVADFLGDFESTCDGIAEWRRRLERDAEWLYGVEDVEGLAQIGVGERLGVVFGLQNAAPLGTEPGRVELLWQLGVRVLQLTYNDATLLGDGCLEDRNAGLTRFGRQVVRECNRVGMLIDVSHVGEAATLEACELSDQPVVATHVNRSALTATPRNKSDEVLRAVAATGGVIGVSSYGPMCWNGRDAPTGADFVDHVLAMVELAGEEAVGVGTDFAAVGSNGAVDQVVSRSLSLYPEIFESYVAAFGNSIEARYCVDLPTVGAWPTIPELLLASGLGEQSVAKIVGGNMLRVFKDVWSEAESGSVRDQFVPGQGRSEK